MRAGAGARVEDELELMHVHGFGGHGAARLLSFNAAGDCVWAAGSLAVVQRCSAARVPLPAAAPPHPLQRFFAEHPAPITSLAPHPNGRLFASSDSGPGPVLVWDSCASAAKDSAGRVGVEIRRVGAVGGGEGAGVGAAAFGWDGAALVTLARDALHSVRVWDWARGALLAVAAGGVCPVLAMGCGGGGRRGEMVTCGVGQVTEIEWGWGFGEDRGAARVKPEEWLPVRSRPVVSTAGDGRDSEARTEAAGWGLALDS